MAVPRRAPLPSSLRPQGDIACYRGRFVDDKRHAPGRSRGMCAKPTHGTQCGAVNERDGHIEISTTNIQLPQWIGEVLRHAHQCDLDAECASDQFGVCVPRHR
jgi:hypothetical protein